MNGHIAQWVILLQEFTFKVFVQLENKHVNANHFNILNTQLGKVPIDDSLPYATLFIVDNFSAKYANIFNYLSLHQFPNGFSKKEKKRLIQKTTPCTIISGTLYKMGKDGLLRHCVSQAEIPIYWKGIMLMFMADILQVIPWVVKHYWQVISGPPYLKMHSIR